MTKRTSNMDLPPLPSDEEVLVAVAELWEGMSPAARYGETGVSANAVAHRLGIKPARRSGDGAVKGSWSGTMSPALRIAQRLVQLAKKDKLKRRTGRYSKAVYLPVDAN